MMNAGLHLERGRFPDVSWAWPPHGHHLLLLAAVTPDNDTAMAGLGEWLRLNELDDASFSEHRLLAAIAGRFGDRLNHLPEYPRLVGIQRLNWTKSRMAVAEICPALMKLTDAGLKVILIKGASRVALNSAEQKVRTSWDVDILLSDEEFETAYGLLARDGWQSARGESVLGLASRLGGIRARNLKKGRFGDVDLHRAAYKPENRSETDDADLTMNTTPVTYYAVPCFVPSPEERLSMAVAHGGLDGESHSDWIIDCVKIIQNETINWPALQGLLKRRRLLGHAEVAFSYIRHGLSLDGIFPASFRSGRNPGRAGLRHLPSLLVSKHPSTMSGPLKLVRRVIVESRKAKDVKAQRPADQPLFLAPLRRCTAPEIEPSGFIGLDTGASDQGGAGQYALQVEIRFRTERSRRRVEFELVSDTRCICQLRALSLRRYSGWQQARFKGKVRLDPAEGPLKLVALPGKYLDVHAYANEGDRYGALPFCLTASRLVRRSTE